MANMYFFWKLLTDPPSPFQRLTRTNKYLRFDSDVANHWVNVGAATHTHTSASSWSCGNGSSIAINAGSGAAAMAPHSHGAPSTYTIDSNNNNPPAYGLDIVYVDLDLWESSLRYFPEGSVILSNSALVDAELSRFSDADGKYIIQAEPGTLVGSDTPQSHTVSGTVQNGGTNQAIQIDGGSSSPIPASHNHTISLSSVASYSEPKNLVTRLYEATLKTSKAIAGSVVFVDGTPGANWEILTSWNGGNLKSGNTDPTLAGSDTHTQAFSGNTSSKSLSGQLASGSGSAGSTTNHNHAVSGTLDSTNHVPESKYIVPARLLNTLIASKPANRVQIIGL